MTSILQSTGLIDTLAPVFENINEDNWDQSIGHITWDELMYDKNFRCCVGLHIAIALRPTGDNIACHDDDTWADLVKSLSPTSVVHNFTDGEGYVLSRMKIAYPEMDAFMMEAIFHCAGSSMRPFSDRQWYFLPIEVLERMKHIETLPPSRSLYDKCVESYYHRQDVILWLEKEQDRINSKVNYVDTV